MASQYVVSKSVTASDPLIADFTTGEPATLTGGRGYSTRGSIQNNGTDEVQITFTPPEGHGNARSVKLLGYASLFYGTDEGDPPFAKIEIAGETTSQVPVALEAS